MSVGGFNEWALVAGDGGECDHACDHACDPHDPGTRRPNASHFLDCPVWAWLGVTPTQPAANQESGA